MPEPSIRQRRVADQLAREISAVISSQAQDPRLAPAVVTGVRVSGDLGSATVFVASMVPEERASMMEALGYSSAYIRSAVASRVYLRRMPTLRFQLDETFDSATRIETILDELGLELAERGDNEDDPGPA